MEKKEPTFADNGEQLFAGAYFIICLLQNKATPSSILSISISIIREAAAFDALRLGAAATAENRTALKEREPQKGEKPIILIDGIKF